MKAILLGLGLAPLFFASCASSPQTAQTPVSSAPRYATVEEIDRLRAQARANFERLRGERSGPSAVASRSSNEQQLVAPVRVTATSTTTTRSYGRWRADETRYAMQIGKKPSEMTAAERAAARGE